jgi:formylglycine-generating enzyme required for sulfatase activity
MMAPHSKKRSLIMVRIPAGAFFMGSRRGHGEKDEFPLHEVALDEYLIGRYLVTAKEWAVFLNDIGEVNEHYFVPSSETTVTFFEGRFYPKRGCGEHPANGVTWHGATAYCRWLTRRAGRPYRLPTEAQWEKAARSGLRDQRYPWGNSSALGRAQFNQIWSNPRHTLCPVGSFDPNAYGLYDMAGNVWEWCRDWYDPEYYGRSPRLNPTGPEDGAFKVLRGGSWGGLDIQIRCGIRVGEDPTVSDSRIGFRLARPA